MTRILLSLAVAGCVIALPNVSNAQQTDPQPTCKMCPGTYIPVSEIEAYVKKAIAEKRTDQQVRDVDIGKANIGIGIVYRGKLDAPAPASVAEHDLVSEVYHIIEGSGTFVTGGTIASARPVAADNVITTILVGPSTSGVSIQGGQSRKVGPGDVIIIPPGVAHWFSHVESDMNYLVVRVDANHVLPGGYVNPAVAR